MTIRYADHVNQKETPQSEPIPGEKQVANNAGGYVFEVDRWARLNRFLVLGSDGGTYYVKEKALTRENANVVAACLIADAKRTIAAIVSVSDEGRAPKNDPAILALAIAASDKDVATRQLAYAALPKVCRIPTHLFHFIAYCQAMRGWSRGLRNAISAWYRQFPVNSLAYELVKYQSRDGWSNKDVLRLAHPKLSAEAQATLRWSIGASLDQRDVIDKVKNTHRTYPTVSELPDIIQAFEAAKQAPIAQLVTLIGDHGLTREMVPTEALNNVEVWEALLQKMPLTALVRNLGKMTAVGLLAPMGGPSQFVVKRLADQAYIKRSRLHPMAIVNALKVYQSGHGDKGSLTWTPVREIIDALDAAFYLSFGNVTPTNKRLMLALDVSGSMQAAIAGTSLTCREAAAVMALVTMNVEPRYLVTGFTAGTRPSMHYGYSTGITTLDISPRQRLDDVVRYLENIPFGGTDCALPMIYATEHKVDVDAFCIYTDSETWAGSVHPKQALAKYRSTFVKDAKQVVVGMTATNFTIADPNDPGTLDIVGFDTATPQAIAAFIA